MRKLNNIFIDNLRLLLIMACLASSVSMVYAEPASHVVISEVLYDPSGTESGGEAIELYNPLNQTVNISGWIVATESSMRDAVLPVNTTIQPCGFYLISDVGWTNAKDNASWPDADYEEAITMYNTDSGIALKYDNGTIIDAVGWGVVSLNFSEGTTHGGVSQGNSLERKPGMLEPLNGNYVDTDNNTGDFIERLPEMQNSLSAAECFVNEEQEPEEETGESLNLSASAHISNVAPIILSLMTTTDDDRFAPGIQISPLPGAEKEVIVRAEVSDDNGFEDISLVRVTINQQNFLLQKTSNINITTDVFEGTFTMNFYDDAGNYLFFITAYDSENLSSNSSGSFEYLSLLALEVDSSAVEFIVSPGSFYDSIGDRDMNTLNMTTLMNAGNTEIDVMISGTDLVSGEQSIGVNNIQYTFEEADFQSILAGTMSTEMQAADINLVSGESSLNELSLRLSAPVGRRPDSYSGTLSLMAVSS